VCYTIFKANCKEKEENEKKSLSVKESKLIYYLMNEVKRLKEELREKKLIE